MTETLRNRGRRHFLSLAAGSAAALIVAPAGALPRFETRRALAFDNLHTGEKLSLVYWTESGYEPEALQRIDWLLRDFRTGQVHPIDPRLLDLLAALNRRLDTAAPYLVYSGYRSPETNARLAEESEGVAKNSLHLQGQAVDLRVPGRRLGLVRRAALSLQGGGVGYYPRSNFVHLDVGRVRHW